MTAESTLSEVVDRIATRFDSTQVLLFGSHARGSAGDWAM